MSDKKSGVKKQKNPAIIIMKRELASYFSGPIAYIVICLFLGIAGFTFFSTFFLQNRAELRNYFGLLPLLLSFFVPALTMRLFAEEKRVGSIETLMTLPVTEVNVVTGKFLAAFIETLIMIAPTLFYVIAAEIFGEPDYGPIIGGFVGAIFLCASYVAIGLFASSITKNQIIAFFVGFIICIVLTMIDAFLVIFPSSVVKALSFLCADVHFSSVAKGIIDSRDILYFVSLTALFFTLTVKVEQGAKK
ncbi:MAG: ABC transporter permease [Treponema sp.]|jgi:ABC-2 type transport system permease protein|nr:ABC transporter permease [Treponema sp.]